MMVDIQYQQHHHPVWFALICILFEILIRNFCHIRTFCVIFCCLMIYTDLTTFTICYDKQYVGETRKDGKVEIGLGDCKSTQIFTCKVPDIIPEFCEDTTTTTPDPTTADPTTATPTTDNPTTDNPTTDSPTTDSPTTDSPTTDSPTTDSPTTDSPTTDSPTTDSPTTDSPTTDSPTTDSPTTDSPTTDSPTTDSPTTDSPTTDSPTTDSPTTDSPTTDSPTTDSPTTDSPTTDSPTTDSPTTDSPTTDSPTTDSPTTDSPTTDSPTTDSPTTDSPTTAAPSSDDPTTALPTTDEPTTSRPTFPERTPEPTPPGGRTTPAPAQTGGGATDPPTPDPTDENIYDCDIKFALDIVFIVDVSCKVTEEECENQQDLVAEVFSAIRGPDTGPSIGSQDTMKVRVAYIEMGSESVTRLVNFNSNPFGKPNAINTGKASYNGGSVLLTDSDASPDDPDTLEKVNQRYREYILGRKSTICDSASLSARSGSPNLDEALYTTMIGSDSLFDAADSTNYQRDRKVLIFSNCGVTDDEREEICERYEDEIRNPVATQRGRDNGINALMINTAPNDQSITSALSDDDCDDYLSCLTEYDPDRRIFCNKPTGSETFDPDVREYAYDSICDVPTPAPTSDPTNDPTSIPTNNGEGTPSPTTPSPTFGERTPEPTPPGEEPTPPPQEQVVEETDPPTSDPTTPKGGGYGYGGGGYGYRAAKEQPAADTHYWSNDNNKNNPITQIISISGSQWAFGVGAIVFVLINIYLCIHNCGGRKDKKRNGKYENINKNKELDDDEESDATDVEIDCDDDDQQLIQ